MTEICLKSTNQKILYRGDHTSIKEALEFAVSQKINLDGLDLTGARIPLVNLDGCDIRHADFTGANMVGANMSEARFINCTFDQAKLENACLCYSEIIKCNFKYTYFQDTDIAQSCLIDCTFQGSESLTLGFSSAHILTNMTYLTPSGKINFSTPPQRVYSRHHNINIFGNSLLYNDNIYISSSKT